MTKETKEQKEQASLKAATRIIAELTEEKDEYKMTLIGLVNSVEEARKALRKRGIIL
jgi:hypothetical protein